MITKFNIYKPTRELRIGDIFKCTPNAVTTSKEKLNKTVIAEVIRYSHSSKYTYNDAVIAKVLYEYKNDNWIPSDELIGLFNYPVDSSFGFEHLSKDEQDMVEKNKHVNQFDL